MRRSRKKKIPKIEKAVEDSVVLKEEEDVMEDEDLLYDDEATKELDMMLILSEAIV